MTEIRPAAPHDVAAVEDVVRAAYGPFAERIGFRPLPLDTDHGARVAAGQVYVTAPDIDAVLVLSIESDALEVDNVAVRPGAQHRGIGGELMSYAFDRAHDEGLVTVRLYTHSLMAENLAWYTRLGFVETGREQLPVGERVHMAKQI